MLEFEKSFGVENRIWGKVFFLYVETYYSFTLGIEGFKSDGLKPTETKEKLVLPASEDIQAEKTHQGLIQGVEKFSADQLKSVKTREPQSPTAQIQVNNCIDTGKQFKVENFQPKFFLCYKDR